MSNKPTPPKSDVFSRTTYTVIYEIDGVRYFEDRSLDVANGDFLGPKSIKRVNEDAGLLGEMYPNIEPNSEEGKKVLNSMIRNNKLKSFAEDWAFNDDETFAAAMESGYIDQARGAASFINESGVPHLDKNNQPVKTDEEIERDNIEIENYIERTQVKNEALSYPPHLEESERGEDYIFIEQFEYAPPQPEVTNDLGEVLKKGIERRSNIRRDKVTGLEEMRGSCRLPIPNNLGVSNGVSWGEARANAVELAGFNQASRTIGGALSGQDNVGKIIRGGVTTGSEIFSQIKDDFKNDGSSDANSATVISAVLARSALSQIGINVDVDQFITRQTGAAINPNLELLFSGPQLRTFSFNFNFAPESKDEAIAVRKIQRWFKQGMLPGRSTVANGSNLFLGSPNIFRIQYKNKERRIKGLNLIKLCALTSCQIDFTPDGTYQSYDDSLAVAMPVRSTMGLTFNELTPIFRDDYINGENNDPSLMDLGGMIKGEDAINDQDIGF